jgi:hypothetical protein
LATLGNLEEIRGGDSRSSPGCDGDEISDNVESCTAQPRRLPSWLSDSPRNLPSSITCIPNGVGQNNCLDSSSTRNHPPEIRPDVGRVCTFDSLVPLNLLSQASQAL